MIRNTRIIILLFAFIMLFSFSFAYEKTPNDVLLNNGMTEVGDWEGDERFANGWSLWSTTSPPASKAYARSAIYVSVQLWQSDAVIKATPNQSKFLCTPEETGCVTLSYSKPNEVRVPCDNELQCTTIGNKSSCSGNDDECGKCSKDYSSPLGCIVSGETQCSYSSCSKPGNQKCYGYQIYVSNGGQTNCTEVQGYYYNRSVSFADENLKTNWRKSRSDAGGYAKKVYIYSYPEEEGYISFDSSGATGTCSAWKFGSNSVNSNTNIKYFRGNPVCEGVETPNGRMAEDFITYLPNQASGSYILAENRFYKYGYDFQGWVMNSDALNSDGTLKGGYTIDFVDQQNLITLGAQNAFMKPAGEPVTLYAVWKKHDYKFIYHSICGDFSGLTQTFLYGTNTAVEGDMDLSSCNVPSISGNGGSQAQTKFIKWYEDELFVNEFTLTSEQRHEDIDLYAKLGQKRLFDYSSNDGQWIFTNYD